MVANYDNPFNCILGEKREIHQHMSLISNIDSNHLKKKCNY